MSRRGSTAPEPAGIAAAAGRARQLVPYRDDPALAAVRGATVGTPALVRSPEGEPAFWLVPFIDGRLACGFARVGLDGRISQLGAFGSGHHDPPAWPDADFLSKVPARWWKELTQRFPEAQSTGAVLSYDQSPAKWSWRIHLGPQQGVAYIGPHGWYVRDAS